MDKLYLENFLPVLTSKTLKMPFIYLNFFEILKVSGTKQVIRTLSVFSILRGHTYENACAFRKCVPLRFNPLTH